MSEIEDIAGAHLGRSADGAVHNRYETPKEIDASLLVGIPRALNREELFLGRPEFVGYDVWNCYEFSALSGISDESDSYNGIIKIVYSSDSENIVESKSLKLYLNSFNFVKISPADARTRIRDDLSKVLGSRHELQVSGHRLPDRTSLGALPREHTHYSVVSPGVSERLRQAKFNIRVRYHFSHLRSNCRVTNQPDYGDVYIDMNSTWHGIEALIYDYIAGLRNENHFHEEICEAIYTHLQEQFTPVDLAVGCFYTRRGGIDINPIRASSIIALTRLCEGGYLLADRLSEKTLRQ
jgi:7-cyano-7-deazaguanine reductase